jgi:predicted nuclease of predicted toxin-antitoxin system
VNMRLVLDQGLPRDAAAVLREQGWECDHVGELGMSGARDTEIIELARARAAVIVTLDADLRALLATSGAFRPSVIRLRLQGLDGKHAKSRQPELSSLSEGPR